MDRERAPLTAEPTAPVGPGFFARLTLANLGLWLAFFAPIQVLLAQQMEAVAPAGKEAALGWVTGAGALVALVANPLFGAASDHTRSRFGRRHPWTLGGTLVGAAALVMLGRQQTLWGVAAWWCVAQAALNAVLAGLSAEVPDRVPVAQRARCSAWVGASQPLGVVLGTVVVTAGVSGTAAGYAAVAGLLLAGVLAFVFTTRPSDDGAGPAPFTTSALVAAPWREPDFAWAWITRFLFNLGGALATLYLLYFLRDAIGYERLHPGQSAEDGLLVLILIYTAGVLAGAFASGPWSDRTGRRRAPVVVAGIVQAAGSALLALWPTWPAAIGAALLTGIGFGIYLAVDQALVTQVLPTAADRGKDLGVINIANSAPQVFGPACAAVLVTQAGGYAALYAVSAVVALAGAMLVRRIRGVP